MLLHKYLKNQGLSMKNIVQVSFQSKSANNKNFSIFFAKRVLLKYQFTQAMFILKQSLMSDAFEILQDYQVTFWKSEGTRLIPAFEI